MTVSWSGYTPGPAYLYICSILEDLPRPEQCFGDTLVVGQTAADGTGSADSPGALGADVLTQIPSDVSGGPPVSPGGTANAECRAATCGVVVTECSNVVSALVAARDTYTLVPGVPSPEFPDDDPLVKVTYEDLGDGQTFDPVYSRRFPFPEDPKPPSRAVTPVEGPKVKVIGGDSGAAVYTTWGRQLAEQYDIGLDFTPVDFRAGIDAVIAGSQDVAVTGAPATGTEQSLVYVPISVNALAVGYNAYPYLPMVDLRVSARSVEELIEPATGQAAQLATGELAADQGRCATGAGATTAWPRRTSSSASPRSAGSSASG